MSLFPSIDESELERLCIRLQHQHGGAFFCVTSHASVPHMEIAKKIRKRLSSGMVQIIDFSNIGREFRFSSESLIASISNNAKYIVLANFHHACGKMSDAEFFQILNLSRDVLAILPYVFIFMMPLYFRVEIARSTPDFNSFFAYHADFGNFPEPRGLDGLRHETLTHENYNESNTESIIESNTELLLYYIEKYDAMMDHESKEAFVAIMNILKFNASVLFLSKSEHNRFYSGFEKLLPKYQNEPDIKLDDVAKAQTLHFSQHIRTNSGMKGRKDGAL